MPEQMSNFFVADLEKILNISKDYSTNFNLSDM